MVENGFTCPNCEVGTLAPRRIAGRQAVVFPGLTVTLPSELELPTCDNCLDYSIPDEMLNTVEQAMQAELKTWQARFVPAQVDVLCERHGVTKRRVAAALGVTPAYLSNIAAGDKAASSTLLRLLHAFVAVPAEFVHALCGRALEEIIASWTEADFGAVFHSNYIDTFGMNGRVEANFDVDLSDVLTATPLPAPSTIRWQPLKRKVA